MKTLVVKFIITCFVCEFIGHSSGVPLKNDYNPEDDTRIKRSPANSFSVFGIKTPFSVPDPITSAQKTLSSFGKLFKPASKTERIEQPTEKQYTVNEIKQIRETTTNLIPTPSTNKGIGTSVSDIPLKSNAEFQNVGLHKHDKNTANEIYRIHSGNKTLNTVNDNGISDTSNKYSNDTYKKNKDVFPVDKDFIDFIFKDLQNITTTEDSSLEYTTETGPYESTTIDDLLRIPSAVVATLLG